MSEFLAPYLKLVALALGPVLVGVACRAAGVPPKVSRYLFSIALYGCQMVIAVLAVWVARIGGQAILLPVVTLAGWLVSAGVAWPASRLMRHAPAQRGSFILTICMSNHGYSLLGIVALVLFGEEGLAQATFAQFLIVPFLVLFCFPLGRFYGEGAGKMSAKELVTKSLADPRNILLGAMVLGLGLNLAQTPRPEWCSAVLRVLVYVGTISSGLAAGLLFRGLGLRKYLRENVFSFVYRSSAYPLFFAGLALALWMGPLDTRILVLFGLVPSALFSNMVADIFDLDTGLTSSVFVTGTVLFLALVLPVYAAFAGMG